MTNWKGALIILGILGLAQAGPFDCIRTAKCLPHHQCIRMHDETCFRCNSGEAPIMIGCDRNYNSSDEAEKECSLEHPVFNVHKGLPQIREIIRKENLRPTILGHWALQLGVETYGTPLQKRVFLIRYLLFTGNDSNWCRTARHLDVTELNRTIPTDVTIALENNCHPERTICISH